MDDGFLKVWSELVAAYWGKASHGDVAEIYAYHLTPFLPGMLHEKLKEEALLEAGSIAHCRMVSLCTTFRRVMNCQLQFEPGQWVGGQGIDLSDWNIEGHPFTARVHIKVIPLNE